MSVLGDAAGWSDLLDDMVPHILGATIDAWKSLPPIAPDEREDDITSTLCRALRRHRSARNLPFQIHTQQVELEPSQDRDVGRLDIVFNLLVPCEEIYFCLEGKRLNVVKNGRTRTYASEYVRLGMMRFITGQYSRGVRHGGMIGYVFDGDIARAIANIESNVRTHRSALRMRPPGNLVASPILGSAKCARESHHFRERDPDTFRIHHLFMAVN